MTTWVVAAFTAAAVLALLVLYFNGPKAWYWHVLSGLAAIGIGLIPTPPNLNTPLSSVVVGFVVVFLLTWAVAAPFVGGRRRSR
jgi:hypothetical protein